MLFSFAPLANLAEGALSGARLGEADRLTKEAMYNANQRDIFALDKTAATFSDDVNAAIAKANADEARNRSEIPQSNLEEIIRRITLDNVKGNPGALGQLGQDAAGTIFSEFAQKANVGKLAAKQAEAKNQANPLDQLTKTEELAAKMALYNAKTGAFNATSGSVTAEAQKNANTPENAKRLAEGTQKVALSAIDATVAQNIYAKLNTEQQRAMTQAKNDCIANKPGACDLVLRMTNDASYGAMYANPSAYKLELRDGVLYNVDGVPVTPVNAVSYLQNYATSSVPSVANQTPITTQPTVNTLTPAPATAPQAKQPTQQAKSPTQSTNAVLSLPLWSRTQLMNPEIAYNFPNSKLTPYTVTTPKQIEVAKKVAGGGKVTRDDELAIANYSKGDLKATADEIVRLYNVQSNVAEAKKLKNQLSGVGGLDVFFSSGRNDPKMGLAAINRLFSPEYVAVANKVKGVIDTEQRVNKKKLSGTALDAAMSKVLTSGEYDQYKAYRLQKGKEAEALIQFLKIAGQK